MAGGSGSRVAAGGGVVFEIQRFAWAAPGRLEVAGRWSGVRGHRFMRPTLDVPGRRPLQALLDHKPWSPDQDEWIAAFSWSGADLDLSEAKLTVTPTISVALPPPDAEGRFQPPSPPRREPEPPPPPRRWLARASWAATTSPILL